jgi:hypothetical protein
MKNESWNVASGKQRRKKMGSGEVRAREREIPLKEERRSFSAFWKFELGSES